MQNCAKVSLQSAPDKGDQPCNCHARFQRLQQEFGRYSDMYRMLSTQHDTLTRGPEAMRQIGAELTDTLTSIIKTATNSSAGTLDELQAKLDIWEQAIDHSVVKLDRKLLDSLVLSASNDAKRIRTHRA